MIKFVYFDVGGVVIKDFSATEKWKELRAFIGVTPKQDAKFLEIWMQYRSRICIDCDIDDLTAQFNSKLGLSIPKTYSLLQGFVDRFEKNESILPVINNIKKTTKVGLLTNMYPRMLDSIKRKRLLPSVEWDEIVDSSVVKLQKPDSKLFELAQKRAERKGNEILFIDNQEKHAKAAKQLGWQSFVYNSADYEKSSKELGEFFDHIRLL